MKNFKIYDTFIFFNELDLLEIRLNILCDVVDYFVLVEATKTFQNNTKELYYENNKHRFDKFKDKIIHIIIDDLPDTDKPFAIEAFHRNGIKRGLVNCSEDDMIIVSDLDEIPNPNSIQKSSQELGKGFLYLRQPLYYYYMNYACNELDNLPWSVICKYQDFTEAQVVRDGVVDIQKKLLSKLDLDPSIKLVSNGGWHFSYLGGIDAIIQKIKSFSHDEYNNSKYLNVDNITRAIENGEDLFGRELSFSIQDMNFLPKYILQHKDKYQHLIYRNSNIGYTHMVFDQFSRYNGLKQILKILGFGGKSTLLDIGSGPECLFGDIIVSKNITYVDPLIVQEDEYHIQGNIFSKNLEERTFDYVSAIDVLEHVPFDIRDSFIRKLDQLATKYIILAFPTSENKESTDIDESVNHEYKSIYGIDYPWLKEHFEYELPSLEQTKQKFEELGWQSTAIGHGYAPWLKEMMNMVIPTWDRLELHDVIMEMSEVFNEKFAKYDFNDPYYREFLILSKCEIENLSSLSHKIDKNIEVLYQELIQDTKKKIYTTSLQTLSEKDEYIQALNNNIQDISVVVKEQGTQLLSKDSIILEKEKQIQEVSVWGQELQKQLSEKDSIILEKEKQIQEVSVWAQELQAQLDKKG